MQRLFLFSMMIVLLGHSTGTIAHNHYEAARQFNSAGLHSLELGNYEKAAEYFISALQYNPANKFYYNNCAAAYMKMGRHGEAKEMLEHALAIDPGYVKALTNMAIVCFHLLQFAESYHYYSLALSADSSFTKRRFQIAKVIRGVKKLRQQHPDNSDLQQILRRLELLESNKKNTAETMP